MGFNLLLKCRLALLLCLWCVCTPIGAGTQPTDTGNLDQIKLKLKWQHQFQFAGYYAAIAKGFYQELGLDVSVVEHKKDEDTFKAVVNDEYQFGIVGSDLIVKRAEGYPVVALAAIYQHSPLVFLTPEFSGIENIHQLAGRRVMIEQHSAELLAYLKAEKIELNELQVFDHTYGVSELISGHVDVISAYLNDEPFNLQEKDIPYRIFMPQSSGIDFYSDVLFTSEAQIKEHPERVKKFLQGTRKGWEYALDHPKEIAELIFEHYSKRHSLAHLLFEAEGARRLILPDVVAIGYMNQGRWAHILEKYQVLGITQKSVDFDRFIYNPDPTPTNYLLMLFQSLEILIALVAVWFVFRFIKMYTSHEVLDRKNKEIQSRLSKNQRRFSLLLTNLPGMAYRCKYDEKWTMIFVSQGSYELTGYYPDELMKNRITSYSDLIIPEDRSAVFATVKESFHRGEPFKTTYRIRCKNGQTKWVWEQGRFTSTTASFKKLRVEGFITDINEAKILENEREKLIEELKNALAEIRELRGILPICASCKKIRDDKGYWQRIESYIQNHTNAEFSHGICPDCAKLLYPEFTLDDRD